MQWLLSLGAALLFVWAVAWLGFHVASAAIHLLLIFAALAFGTWLVRRLTGPDEALA